MKVLLWADASCAGAAIAVIGRDRLAGLVGAANRPSDWPALNELARTCGVPMEVQPLRRDSAACAAFADRLAGLGADWSFVCSYSMILPKRLLELPPLGTINLHAGLLPEYRGANVLNWVLVNGESETGITVHYMDEGIDTGDIILRERVPVAWDDTALSLQGKLTQLWPRLLERLVAMVESGNCPRHKQDESRARHWPRRRAEDGRIDWRWPAERIYHLIRALVKPWPGAYFDTADGKRVVLDVYHTLEEVRALQRRYAADAPRHAA